MKSNFLLGELKLEDAARIKLKRIPMDLIARHAIQEHGVLNAKEAAANEAAMKSLGEIKSRYFVDPTNHDKGCVLVTTRRTWDRTMVSLERS